MPKLRMLPHDGINRRLPEHKMVSDKKQFVKELYNLLSLDERIYKVPGARRFDSTAKSGACTWAKRIYYKDGEDSVRHQFAIINRLMFKGNEQNGTLNQVKIDDSLEVQIEDYATPIDATLKLNATSITYLVDGRYFYKFDGNGAGAWDRLPIKVDVDGNNIEPTYIAEYLDRMFILVKNRNVLIFTKNRNPENTSDSTDAGIIELPPGNGGYPTALVVLRGFLFVIHQDYIVPVSGSSASTFGVKPGDVIRGYGSNAPRSVINIKDYFGFLNTRDNEYYLSGGTQSSTQQSPLSYELNLSELMNPYKSQLTTCHFDSKDNLIRIAYVPTGQARLNFEEIYSLNEKKWCGQTRDRYISCYSQWDGEADNGELLTGRSDTGLLMVNDVAQLNFDSTAIRFRLVSGAYMADEEEDVIFDDMFLDAKPHGDYSIPINYYLDSRLTTFGNTYFKMQGEFTSLGQIVIADQNIFEERGLFLIDKNRGRMIRIEIDIQDLNREFEMYGIYINYHKAENKFSRFIAGR